MYLIMEGVFGNNERKYFMVMFKWIKLLLLVELWWSKIHYLNQPLWTFTIRKYKNREQKSIFDWYQATLMWRSWLTSNDSTKGQIYPWQFIQFYERNNNKYWESKSVLGFNSSEENINLTNYDISDINMNCEMCIKELWNDISRKIYPLK